jgi:NAD(P)-dependent dehydrogenase (short-subunit alcohol dehydrogenase family)
MGLLDRKVAVVTGGGRGIGRSHALALAKEGASVVVNDVGLQLVSGDVARGLEHAQPSPAVAQAVVDEIVANGGRAVADATNVATIEAASGVIATAIDAFGDIDILVNNAGAWHEATIFDVDDARFDGQFGGHLRGTIGTTRAAVNAMREAGHGGRIINTISGIGGTGTVALYLAAKAAIMSYTLATAADGAEYGITANGISPLAITRTSQTFFFREAVDPGDEATIAHIGPHINSPVVVFLASDLAAGITGKFFGVSPDSFNADSPIRIREVYVGASEGFVSSEGLGAPEWTPQEIAASLPKILH